MAHFHLIAVGKLKNKNIEVLEQDYLKRLKTPLKIHEVKAHGEEVQKEEQQIRAKIKSLSKSNRPTIILLTEHGKLRTSHEFSSFIQQLQSEQSDVLFIIGGSLGFQKSFLDESQHQLSLSPMILPHKLARLVFIEQFYRAETILTGHPYSH